MSNVKAAVRDILADSGVAALRSELWKSVGRVRIATRGRELLNLYPG